MNETKQFVVLIWFTGWENLSLGVNIDIKSPNMEIHVPFYFLRIGWEVIRVYRKEDMERIKKKSFIYRGRLKFRKKK